MKQEDKELLIKDLCARLPYGVKLETLEGPQKFDIKWLSINMCNIANPYLPYLLPLASMTHEQKEFIKNKFCYDWDIDDHPYSWWANCIEIGKVDELVDWFLENHFDYRGLIEKGLAIDATNLNIY